MYVVIDVKITINPGYVRILNYIPIAEFKWRFSTCFVIGITINRTLPVV